ncbi:hypothetical protein KHC33_14565 [Methanospirillum sp. J.3.6.1-F.2.7.3]|uniref:Uncharacterized protein n=2 Tax=Methanospirillum TaxID=2202 RepID=A0A8E7EJJ7_9EURY|nr:MULTISPECIES: hypothetical protein [Methanospirillum]MDX8548833.1 hypothetical protein [Methanospirillum hungatei]NLW75227.1 hypothetical protein [Methanomicrobiales archaeon]QVV88530.1 hypothetical protein KHC33_14565 [Methanospirillum sp. J.3.6.1-F.2.7.3]QXO94105.1 hypothetical protein KSK55_12305 [Methanospirillum hungatei]
MSGSTRDVLLTGAFHTPFSDILEILCDMIHDHSYSSHLVSSFSVRQVQQISKTSSPSALSA